MATISYALRIGDNDLTVAVCMWQFRLIAIGMAMLVVCALSPRLRLCRTRIPGAAFMASIFYSVYLSHKLVIHAVTQLCSDYQITHSSAPAIFLVEVLIYAAGVLLLAVERLFLLLRRRVSS